MRKSIIFIAIVFIQILFISCQHDNLVQPEIINYEMISLEHDRPFSVLDNNNYSIVLWGQDLVSYSYPELFSTDGELDSYYMTKYDSKRNTLINGKSIISSSAVLKLRAFVKNNMIFLVWLDPRNNPSFKASIHPYAVDVYYKIIDYDGNTIKEDTRLTNELMSEYEAYSSFDLKEINSTTMKEIGTFNVFTRDAKTLYLYKSYFIFSPSKEEHHLKIMGQHWNDSCYLSYSKLTPDSTIIIKEKSLITFKKISGEQWGPDIQSLYFNLDSNGNLHISWQLTDGRGYLYYYYMLLNKDGEIEYCNMVGKVYNL